MSDVAVPDLGPEIVRLTDETLDRIGPRLDYYARHPDRAYPDGSALLVAGTDYLVTDAETRQAKIVVCNRASKLVLNDMVLDLLPELIEPFSHGEKDIGEDEGYELVGLDVGFTVLRARFPQGHPNFDWTRFPSPNDPAEYDPDVMGLRHAVGATITSFFEDKDSDVVSLAISTEVQKRFDAPKPQHKTKSVTHRQGTTKYRHEEYREPATEEHVARISGLLTVAKDIRPFIQPIEHFRRQRAQYAELLDGVLNRDQAA